MISDITEYPYYCADCDSWHMLLFELDDAGMLYEGDTDGNWDAADRDAMPTDEECGTQFSAYAEWVRDNGIDPLSQYNVKYTEKVKTVWYFRFAPSLLGICVASARPEHGKSIRPMDLKKTAPGYVLEYLNLRDDMKQPVLADLPTIAELRKAQPSISNSYRLKTEIEHEEPRPAAVVRSELIKKAK